MKLQIETNIVNWISARKRTFIILAAELLAVGALLGSAWLFNAYQPLIRDFYIANVAHQRAGDVIPFTEEIAQWSGGFKIDQNDIYAFGLESNSIWVANYVRLIVPYMTYEHVIESAWYPRAANVVPFGNTNSFHVAGRMYPNENVIFLNERYFLDPKWNDQRRALETLVHELVHIQRGNFIYGTSAELESATSAATTEILAAMCNYGDELACKSFWHEIENLSRSSLLIQLNKIGAQGLYETWANTFWRDSADTDAYSKSMRFWADSPGDLLVIREKYALVPWMDVIYGVVYDIPLDTGNPLCILDSAYDAFYISPTWYCVVIGMPFDDARYLLQDLMWILE